MTYQSRLLQPAVNKTRRTSTISPESEEATHTTVNKEVILSESRVKKEHPHCNRTNMAKGHAFSSGRVLYHQISEESAKN